MNESRIHVLLVEFQSTDQAIRDRARNQLIGVAVRHMRHVAQRMLRRFPIVRRWDETDDVVQGAALRLDRALAGVVPQNDRHLLGIMAMQIRRELLELSRKYSRSISFAQNHESNADLHGSHEAVDSFAESTMESLASWTEFHETAEALNGDERELFQFVWYLGMNQQEVAHMLGCSVRTVARRWELTKRHFLVHLGKAPPT